MVTCLHEIVNDRNSDDKSVDSGRPIHRVGRRVVDGWEEGEDECYSQITQTENVDDDPEFAEREPALEEWLIA